MANDKRTESNDDLTIDRAPRSSEKRASTRHNDAWVPAGILPTPEPRDGLTFRWIRTSMLDKVDNKNVSKKFREGWTPVTLEDHPELENEMSDIDSRWKGSIESGGLLLCKIPTEQIEKRRAYYQNLARGQMDAVDESYFRENDPRMPMLTPDRKSRTTFGGS